MTFDDYDDAAGVTAVYPGRNSGSKEALAYTALGLVGEGGEYSEKVKKYLRDGYFDPVLAAKELGDVLWYVSAAARELGYSLQTVAEWNIEKLHSRRERGTLKGNGDER